MSNLNDFFAPEDKVVPGVILIDMSQISLATTMHTFEEGQKLTTPMVRHLILSTLKFNVMKFKNEYPEIIVCLDNAKNGYWRRDYAYYYKLNRKQGREESKWDWDGYFEGMHTVMGEFKVNMPYPVIDIDKAEADDAIAVLTKKFALEGRPVLIVSSDGDFVQLHKYKGVKQWSPMQKKFVKPKSGSVAVDLMTKLVKGDKKDNVASIKVRSDFWYTHVEGERTPPTKTSFILDMVDAEDPMSLLSESEKVRFIENQKLIDFDFIDEKISASILECYNNYQKPPRKKIYPYFVKSGLSKLLQNVNDF